MLFPYARAHIRGYLEAHAGDAGVRADVALLRAEHAGESQQARLPSWDPADDLGSAEAYVYWLMDRDRKSTGLKSLQGRIWEAGYRAGALKGKGEVYPDVRPALARWRRSGKQVAIFSSGSVQAQRNLFANTIEGDLSAFIVSYFDTTTGPKREAASYRKIASALRRAPTELLFISDVPAELDAARQAGLRTALCVRDVRGAVPTNHPRIRSFRELA